MSDRLISGWIDQYKDLVFSYAAYCVGDRDAAADVTQEVFMKLWAHRDAIQPGAVKAWLMTVTRNQCIDHGRRKRRELPLAPVEISGERGVSPDPVATDPDPEQRAIDRDLAEALRAAIQRLPPAMQNTIILREIHQFSYHEIAAIQGVSLDVVKVTLHRARKKLFDLLRENQAITRSTRPTAESPKERNHDAV